jgi:hypothetical protein
MHRGREKEAKRESESDHNNQDGSRESVCECERGRKKTREGGYTGSV